MQQSEVGELQSIEFVRDSGSIIEGGMSYMAVQFRVHGDPVH